jgi:hypothetical protein
VPDFCLTVEAAMGLFPVIAGAVATTLLAFIRPAVTQSGDGDGPG